MTRRDFLNDPKAPAANSVAVACSAFIQDDNDQILMIRRSDNGLYSIPGGQLEPGETLTECVVREVKEETGIDVQVVALIGIYSNPNHVIAYDDGEVRQEFSICFRCVRVGGRTNTSSESSEVLWMKLHDLHDVPIHPSTLLRIGHGVGNVTNLPYYT